MKKIVTFTITESDPERIGILTMLLAEAGVNFAVSQARDAILDPPDSARIGNGAAWGTGPTPRAWAKRPIRKTRITAAIVAAVQAGLKAGKGHRALARATGVSVCSVGRIAKGERNHLLIPT